MRRDTSAGSARGARPLAFALLWRPPLICGLMAVAPAPARAAVEPADPQIGLTETFFASNWGSQADIQVRAWCGRWVSTVCSMWSRVASSRTRFCSSWSTEFDTIVYPRVTAALGSEPNPGIDGNPRVVILIYGFNDAALMGSFSPYDLIPHGSVDPPDSPTSNHREMFYLNLDAVQVQPDRAAATAAHELAHLILYYRDFLLDPSAAAHLRGLRGPWVEEGLAMYAELAAGYGERARTQLFSFQMSPNKNLTYWPPAGGYLSDYGASYAFITYLVDREGFDLAAQLVGEPLDGIAGIDAVLRARGTSDTFATLFDDWVLTNFLDSRPPALLALCVRARSTCSPSLCSWRALFRWWARAGWTTTAPSISTCRPWRSTPR